MDNRSKNDKGIKMLVQKCREEFRHAENKNYYTDEDYKAVERKFVRAPGKPDEVDNRQRSPTHR